MMLSPVHVKGRGRGVGHRTTARATRDVARNSARIDVAGPRTRMVRDHAVMKRLVAGPAGHVIVHGLEGLGLRVVEHLVALGLEVVAVDDGARAGAGPGAAARGGAGAPPRGGAAAARWWWGRMVAPRAVAAWTAPG